MDDRPSSVYGRPRTEPGVQADSSAVPHVRAVIMALTCLDSRALMVGVGQCWVSFDGPVTALSAQPRPARSQSRVSVLGEVLLVCQPPLSAWESLWVVRRVMGDGSVHWERGALFGCEEPHVTVVHRAIGHTTGTAWLLLRTAGGVVGRIWTTLHGSHRSVVCTGPCRLVADVTTDKCGCCCHKLLLFDTFPKGNSIFSLVSFVRNYLNSCVSLQPFGATARAFWCVRIVHRGSGGVI